MKILAVLFIFLSSLSVSAQQAFAPPQSQKDGWALGVGFGTEADFDSVMLIDIKSPRLFSFGAANVALVLSLESKDVAGVNQSLSPMHLLFDMAYNPYKDVVKSYIRLGAGPVFVSDPILLKQESLVNIQIQFGAEFVSFKDITGVYSTFFIQAMLNSPAMRNPPLNGFEIYDGTSLVVGMRNYF